MKFLHCSDLHFDSRLNRYLSADKASLRAGEILHTFGRLIDYAKLNDIDTILICGDMFDGKQSKLSTRKYIQQIIEQSGITFLYIRGNHDKDTKLFEQTPQNFIELDGNIVEIDGVKFGGVGFCLDYLKKLDFAKVDVCLLHGNIYSNEIDVKLLARQNIAYLALGDIHKHACGREKGMIYAYSGCLDGRGFDECDERGFCEVEIDKNKDVSVRFVPFSSRMYHATNIDISGQFDGLITKIESVIASCIKNKDDLYKIILCGSIEEGDIIDTSMLESFANDLAFFVKIENNTTLKIDLGKYKTEKTSLKSVFIKKTFESDLSEEEKNKIAMLGIKALCGEDIVL